jgi:hypothetical protein
MKSGLKIMKRYLSCLAILAVAVALVAPRIGLDTYAVLANCGPEIAQPAERGRGQQGHAAARRLALPRHHQRPAERIGDHLRPGRRADERAAGGDDLVQSSVSFTLQANVENLFDR